MTLRITDQVIRDLIKNINTYEFHVNREESDSVHSGELWRVDILNEGVYISRRHANPTHTNNRLSKKEAWMFLTGVEYVLYAQYIKQGKL